MIRLLPLYGSIVVVLWLHYGRTMAPLWLLCGSIKVGLWFD